MRPGRDADGALFLNAYSQTNTTNPSHVAIFTGRYAIDSRIMNNHTAFAEVAEGVDTLPEAFQRANYRPRASRRCRTSPPRAWRRLGYIRDEDGGLSARRPSAPRIR